MNEAAGQVLEGTSGAAQPAPKQRIVFLDGLRFIAATAVLVQHGFETQGPIGRTIVDLLSPGVFGVVLFFMISGFVIPMSIGRNFKPATFAIRRIFRIYPLVLASFAFIAFCAFVLQAPAYEQARHASPAPGSRTSY